MAKAHLTHVSRWDRIIRDPISIRFKNSCMLCPLTCCSSSSPEITTLLDRHINQSEVATAGIWTATVGSVLANTSFARSSWITGLTAASSTSTVSVRGASLITTPLATCIGHVNLATLSSQTRGVGWAVLVTLSSNAGGVATVHLAALSTARARSAIELLRIILNV